MSLLSIQNLAMDFAGDFLFRDLSLELWPKQKAGLIGANGAGKTTLFRLILGKLEPTQGDITAARDCKIGYLEQHACADSRRSIYEEALTVFAPLMEREEQLRELEARLEQGEQLSELYLEKQEEFGLLGGLTFRSRTRAVLLGLGFSQAELEQSCDKLSGGQRSKVSMAKLLLSQADLLLLDEPTNHLDLAATQWLEKLLRDYPGACLIISHDRYFLDQVTGRTFAMANGKLTAWEGNYSAYLKQKEEHDALLERHYVNDMREIKRIEGIIEQQRRWGREKNIITAESKQKMLDKKRAELTQPDKAEQTLHFQFQPEPASCQEVLTVTGLSKAFGEKRLFTHADFLLQKEERVFLLGPNGCGKTTFLRILREELPADAGHFSTGNRVRMGYFAQNLEGLHPEKTVIDEIWDAHRDFTETQVRSALAIFLFTRDEVFKRVSALSGGEKAKLALLKLMLSGANLLLLDEPTNHLDIASREALEDALLAFPGTMLVVTHDRYFLKKLSTRIVEMRPEGLVSYRFGYEEYLEQSQKKEELAKQTAQREKQPSAYQLRKERESEKRRLESRLRRCEERIAELETAQEEKQAQLNQPETAADYEKLLELTQAVTTGQEELERLLEEWEGLQGLLSE